jgi:hypothetical protein
VDRTLSTNEVRVDWDEDARDIVGLTPEQREAIEDWMDEQ